jgi:hypothetical protein
MKTTPKTDTNNEDNTKTNEGNSYMFTETNEENSYNTDCLQHCLPNPMKRTVTTANVYKRQ